jgi:hypothetical protein
MFRRAIVLDVITHPIILNNELIERILNNKNISLYRVKTKELLKDLPRNSIVATFDNAEQQLFVAIPFFSSHMSLPIKPNEEVWIYEDTTKTAQSDIEFFWLSRIHNINFIEDVNYTHADRKFLKNYNAVNIALPREIEIPTPMFNNGPVRNNSNLSSNDKLLRERDIKQKPTLNISGKWLLESVPRFTKDPGDYVIQGSNNTLIKLGTDKARKKEERIEKYYNSLAYNDIENNSGTIDIVAGRCGITHTLLTQKEIKTQIFGGQSFTTLVANDVYKNAMFSIYNEKNYLENMKDNRFYLGLDNQNIAEGDADFYTDISRLYISERCDGDGLLNNRNLLKIDSTGIKKKITNVKRRGFIIGKSDEIRLVARGQIFKRDFESKFQNNQSGDIFELLDTPQSGSIKIIKEGLFDDDRAYISLDHDGVVSIDGPKIVLGDSQRKKANGLGDNIYLGHDAKEPVVLGFQLKERLEQFMDQVVLAFNNIGKSLDELSKHQHQYAGPTGITLPPEQGVSTNLQLTNQGTIGTAKDNFTLSSKTNVSGEQTARTFDATDLGKILGNIQTLKTELNQILSTLVKTN